MVPFRAPHLLLIAVLLLAACGDSAPSAEMIARGKDAFSACAGCHAVGGGDDAYSIGPNLAGIYKRKAGSQEGFGYSEAMAGSGIVWNRAQLDNYLADPQAMVSGTTMVFDGIQSDEERAAIIAYLRSESE
ncbi:MAG: c-type cytochrome [Pseudomonadota bacterium]